MVRGGCERVEADVVDTCGGWDGDSFLSRIAAAATSSALADGHAGKAGVTHMLDDSLCLGGGMLISESSMADAGSAGAEATRWLQLNASSANAALETDCRDKLAGSGNAGKDADFGERNCFCRESWPS